jgi:hypothetical protein
MKNKPLLTLLIVFAGMASACFQTPQKEADRPFRSGTLTHYSNGNLMKARLVEAAVVNDCPARKNTWVHYYETGQVDGLQLSQEHEISGRLIPAKSTVWFDQNGALKTTWLSQNTTYDGVPCDGGPGKVATGFYPDGTLKYAFLHEGATIDGVPCTSSVFHSVRFHPNGQLSGARVSRSFTYRGTPLPRGHRIHLDESGNLLAE